MILRHERIPCVQLAVDVLQVHDEHLQTLQMTGLRMQPYARQCVDDVRCLGHSIGWRTDLLLEYNILMISADLTALN